MCGIDEDDVEAGSPPLTRELRKRLGSYELESRITPAYAGTTIHWNLPLAVLWDHPRLRGNYRKTGKAQAEKAGSPPLTRELLFFYNFVRNKRGITPAYAGTTHECYKGKRLGRDHPRLRGNYSLMRTK